MLKDVDVFNATLRIRRTSMAKDRPTIIFLHDSLGCIELWRDFPHRLGEATNCNIFIYDRQGYGQSIPFTNRDRSKDYLELEADVLSELMEQCQIKEAILFGHSDGGSIGLITAAKYPSKIRGLITEGAHVFVEEITLKGIRKAVEVYENANLKERLQKYHGKKTDTVFWAWAKTWLSDDFRTWNIERFLSQITCPLLVIQGEQDEYGTLAQVNSIIRQVSGKADSLIIPFIGHTPHKETNSVVLTQSASFINRLIYLS